LSVQIHCFVVCCVEIKPGKGNITSVMPRYDLGMLSWAVWQWQPKVAQIRVHNH